MHVTPGVETESALPSLELELFCDIPGLSVSVPFLPEQPLPRIELPDQPSSPRRSCSLSMPEPHFGCVSQLLDRGPAPTRFCRQGDSFFTLTYLRGDPFRMVSVFQWDTN